MAEPKQKRHWLSRLSFGTVSLVAASLLVLSYLSVVIDPAKAWFFTLFGILYPIVLPLTVALWVWALIRKSRMRLLLTLALLPSLFFAGRYYRALPHKPAGKEATLKMVSYNVGLFAHGPEGMTRIQLADSVSQYLMGLDADIICLQEFFLPSGMPLDFWISHHFPGYKAEASLRSKKSGHFGNLTLSRRPVSDRGRINFEQSANMAFWTDIRLDSSTIRLYNCHFESYNISIPRLIKKKDGAVEETEQKMRHSITERPKQVSAVLENIENAPVRSVVAGDFNDTPLSYTYFRLLRGRKDSFTRVGKGFGATYSLLWPLLRIDYQLYPGNLEAVSYHIERVNYSDHYPIISTYYETGRDSQ